MPVIRQIEANRGLGGAPQPGIQVDQSIGRAVSGLGNSLENAAEARQQLSLRRDQMNMEINDFRADQGFRQMNNGLGVTLEEVRAKTDASGQGMTENFLTQFDKKSQEYLSSVPNSLKPKYTELIATSRATWVDKVARDERDQRYSWFRTGIQDAQSKLQTDVFNDPALFDAAKSDGLRAIDSSGLPESEKTELRKKWDEALSLTVGEREVRDAEADPTSALNAAERLGVQGANPVAAVVSKIIGAESGGNPNAKNPNSSASGIGQFLDSTWLTTVRKHRPDLAGRTDAELLGLKSDPVLGREMTTRLTMDNANALAAAKLPVTPGTLYLAHFAGVGGAKAVLNRGDDAQVADVLGPAVVNANGFLRGKTVGWLKDWADKKMGGKTQSVPEDQRYASLSLDKRLEIYDRMLAAANRGQAAIDAQRKAANDAAYDNLRLGIETGDVVSRQTILGSSAIDNGQKATLLNSLDAKLKENAGVAEVISAITGGGKASINAFDADQAKIGDKAYSQMLQAVPADRQQAVTTAFVQSTGYIPKSEVASLRGENASNNAANVVSAMQKAYAYQELAPAHFNNAEGLGDTRKNLDLFKTYVDQMGYTAQEAAQKIIEARDPQKQRDREALLKSKPVTDSVKGITAAKVAASFDTSPLGIGFNPSLGNSRAAEAAMLGEYKTIYEEAIMDANGDLDAAKNLADQRFARTHGTSSMTMDGDSVIVKLPPEKVYPAAPDGTHDYIMRQAQQALAEEGVQADRVYLQADDITQKDIDAGKPARYQVYYEQGGKLERFMLPFYADVDAMKQEYDAKEKRRLRDAARRMEENRARELQQFPEGRDGPERFSNDQLYRGAAREGSPLADAIKRRQEETNAARERAAQENRDIDLQQQQLESLSPEDQRQRSLDEFLGGGN